MSLLQRLWGRRQHEEKASAAGSAIAAYFLGQPVWTPRDFTSLADESYLKNAVAYRCVKLIATSAASAPWLLYGKGGQEIDAHPLLDLLDRPAPMIGGHSLFEALYAYLLLAGNSYLEGVGADGKPPRELWALRPDRTKVIAGRFGLPAGYEYEANGLTKRWDADPLTGMSPILHLKEFHPLNDWYGLSRTEPAAYGIDRHNAAGAHNKALLDNGARPSGALIFEPVKGADGSEQAAPAPVIEAAKKALAEKTGPTNAGRPMVFGGNVRWEEMATSPKDMDFIGGKEDAARDICTAYGVPHILIVPGQSTYNNVREAKLELWEDTILPLLDRTLDSLNAWLTPQFGDGLKLAVDLDDISALEPRRETRRKSVVELLEKGVLDEDEAREALQYGPRKPDAVKKVDAAVLTALVNAAQADTGMWEPLFRYLRAVGLVAPDAKLTDLMDLAASLLADTQGELDATTPPGDAPPVEDPADAAD